MRVVVTGGTGFIGRPLCQKLLELRHTVTVLTRNPDAARSRLDPRIGVVLGRNGGALARMLPAFRLGLGGPLGSGTQWLSWIHLDDLIELLLFLFHEAASGPVNATAPQPVTNEEFSRVLGQTLRRPAWFRTPAFALKFLLGQMAEELLLTGQRVLPARAEALGFRFRYPTLSEALHAILH